MATCYKFNHVFWSDDLDNVRVHCDASLSLVEGREKTNTNASSTVLSFDSCFILYSERLYRDTLQHDSAKSDATGSPHRNTSFVGICEKNTGDFRPHLPRSRQ
jgi:hypothetical protein